MVWLPVVRAVRVPPATGLARLRRARIARRDADTQMHPPGARLRERGPGGEGLAARHYSETRGGLDELGCPAPQGRSLFEAGVHTPAGGVRRGFTARWGFTEAAGFTAGRPTVSAVMPIPPATPQRRV